MSVLYLVRHGQASFGAADYDKLSEMGEKQCAMLGHYWIKFNVKLNAVYCGTLSRQKRSAECVSEVFKKAGRPFPEPKIIDQFNEYETRHILTASLSSVLAQNPEIMKLAKEIAPNGMVDFVNDKKAFQKLFSRVMDMWVDDKIHVDGMESWKQFTARVNDWHQQGDRGTGRGQDRGGFHLGRSGFRGHAARALHRGQDRAGAGVGDRQRLALGIQV